MQIKAFSEKYNVPADTIRYYEKEGLLHPKRLENDYRFYDEDCANELKMLIVLKQLGFTLSEINELNTLEKKEISTSCNVAAVSLISLKMQQLTNKIEYYQHALQTLQNVKHLIHEEKYKENQQIINDSITELFNNTFLKGD